ncbi:MULTISPECIES: hypothetical protein [unclassified Microbacterium]|uniref:hypothetical protein n=1 Tax=unclassified Microbacterium TaxID=2609290 RepID=UPI000F558B9D|nr:hypothetical protein [Microbacterium sp. ABRD28]AZC13702.1 hypothetical protein DT073_08225 [Microbacterium sp. ABRD28]
MTDALDATDPLAVAIVVIFLFLCLCAALVLVTVAQRRPHASLLSVAAGLVLLALVVVAVLPYNVPVLLGAILAFLGVALAVLGGNPFTRWVLVAADGRTTEGPRGGILVELAAEHSESRQEEILRGGTTIGFLERASIALGILAGFPAVIAVVVALKGVGRFSELATPAARERFIVGTLASLLWASAVAAAVWLAIW